MSAPTAPFVCQLAPCLTDPTDMNRAPLEPTGSQMALTMHCSINTTRDKLLQSPCSPVVNANTTSHDIIPLKATVLPPMIDTTQAYHHPSGITIKCSPSCLLTSTASATDVAYQNAQTHGGVEFRLHDSNPGHPCHQTYLHSKHMQAEPDLGSPAMACRCPSVSSADGSLSVGMNPTAGMGFPGTWGSCPLALLLAATAAPAADATLSPVGVGMWGVPGGVTPTTPAGFRQRRCKGG
jgi:hypothetical protein